MSKALGARGITEELLAERLWDELSALETKTLKVKGQVQDLLPDGWRVIAETEFETVIQWDEVCWRVRQSARMDAHKLLNLYPAERHEHSGPGGGPIETRDGALEAVIDKYLSDTD